MRRQQPAARSNLCIDGGRQAFGSGQPRPLKQAGESEGPARRFPTPCYALYEVETVWPPRPVQSVWKNSPRGRSIRS